MSNRIRRRTKLGVCAVLLALTLAGCRNAGDDPYYANTAYLSRQDVVPLTRPLPLVAMSEPMVIDFELPAPGSAGTSTLALGLRVSGRDAYEAFEASQSLQVHGPKARVELNRLTSSGERIAVPLTRLERNYPSKSKVVAVGRDGMVEGAWPEDVDTLAMWAAGLDRESSSESYEELSFARVGDAQPGTYQLVFQLTEATPELAHLKSELLIAYRRPSK